MLTLLKSIRDDDEFEYLISAGIALNVQAITTPTFPLIGSSGKDHTVHSALNTSVEDENYHVKKAVVLSDDREIMIIARRKREFSPPNDLFGSK